MGRNLLRFLSDHLENPEHHPLVIGCDTPKDIRLRNIQQTTTITRPLSDKHDYELRLFLGQGIPSTLTIFVAHLQ